MWLMDLKRSFPMTEHVPDPRWQKFNADYAATYREKPEQFASLAYDAMNVLLGSVCEAGLNKGRIMDALAQVYEYDGVTGHMVFDTNSKNIAPMYLARVRNGKIEYRPATMEPKAQPSEPTPAAPTGKPVSEITPTKGATCTVCARWRGRRFVLGPIESRFAYR